MVPPEAAKTQVTRLRAIVVFLFLPLACCANSVYGQKMSGLQAAAAMEQVLIEAIAKCEKSVVAIGLYRTDKPPDSSGIRIPVRRTNRSWTPELDEVPDSYSTGVVIDRSGLLLTSWHVLEGKRQTARLFVRIGGQPVWREVQVKAADPYSDLAVLEIEGKLSEKLALVPITLADTTQLKKGQIVIALGNPYAIARDGASRISNIGGGEVRFQNV